MLQCSTCVDIILLSYTLCIRLIICQSLLLPNTYTHLLKSHPFPLSLLSSFVITLHFSRGLPHSCRFVVLNHHSALHQGQICDSLHSAAYQNIPSIFPRSRSLKSTRCSSFFRFFLVTSLAFDIRDIFLSHSGVSSSSYNSFIARALAVLLLSLPPCLPACSYLTYCCFPHRHCLFLSLDHLLHIIIPPPCLVISWGSPPCCNAQHLVSYTQNRRALLLPSSCTISTALTFFNTVSLNFILGFSSFNLHHFIIGVGCSGVQRFLP